MASSKPFQGLTFYVPIGSSLKKTTKQLQSLIGGHGGALSGSFNDNVSYALVSDIEMASNSNLVEKALKKGVAVISEAWLQHTVKNGSSPVNAPNGTIVRPAHSQKNALIRNSVPQVPYTSTVPCLTAHGPKYWKF